MDVQKLVLRRYRLFQEELAQASPQQADIGGSASPQGTVTPSFGGKAGRRRGTPGDVLRAAEAEAQAEAARALIGADMGPDVNSATSPVRGARNRKGCTEVAK